MDYGEDYAPDGDATLLIATGAVLLIVCIVGIYLYRRRTFEQDHNGEFMTAIAGDENFEFPKLAQL
jgi:hypothetical protein